MDRERAQQQLAAILRERTTLIKKDLGAGERVLDCADVNETSLNRPHDLAAGESLLFVTNRRLILYRPGSSESFPYPEITKFGLTKAPWGVPMRRQMRTLSISLATGQTRELLGGFMFFDSVVATLREHT